MDFRVDSCVTTGAGKRWAMPFSFVVQRINLHWSFHGYLFTPLVQGIGVWLPGLVHCSFAAVACASRVFESVGVFLYRCQISEVVKRFLGVN